MKTRELLNKIFLEIDEVVLKRQHPVTGLLPASTAVTTHGDYTDAWVRDNVYSVMCVWALCLAYRKQGDKVRSDELEQAVVKLMRGLLQSMMRQSDKVETFKNTLNPTDALHAKYDTATGLPVVADDAWGHAQIDATSLFLLMVGQMTASGLRIVLTYSEVDFIQNLIYYIASAYRTPDFGIWERGNKINNGKTEINASSLGMAKAALQALDGFNLFGKNASPRAIVHTVADAISMARATLSSLLPRESLSKEVDSALLSVIGFPAFAVGDEKLVRKTRDKILATLGGEYGCKRFIWDGHQTELEDSSRLYYEHTELANFENVESEWPLFFCFLYVDALFNENQTTAKHYREKIEKLMVHEDGIGLIPELYYLPEENIAAEKINPRSQRRVPNENVPLVWAQSLYWCGLLMDEGVIEPDDLDPLKMRRRSTRFVQPQIALVVLAEDDQVKDTLISNGVISETIDEIRPIKVISTQHLLEAYGQLGANYSLGLTGRPPRRLQTLSTSQTYEINQEHFLCLSWIQSHEDNYRSFDAERIALKLEQEITHIRRHWLNTEVAVFTFLVDRSICELPGVQILFETLKNLQLKATNERVGYASAKLAFRASRVNHFSIPNLCLTPLKFNAVYKGKSLIECIPKALLPEALEFSQAYKHAGAAGKEAADIDNYRAVKRFLKNHKLDEVMCEDNDFTVKDLLSTVYRVACQDNHWLTARFCFITLDKVQSVLADGLTLLTARHLSVYTGNQNTQYLNPHEVSTDRHIADAIARVTDNLLERALTQEVVAIIGSLVRVFPDLFEGVRSIYIHNLLSLCVNFGKENGQKEMNEEEILELLAALSPAEFLGRLMKILESQRQIFNQGLKFNFSRKTPSHALLSSEAEQAHAMDTDWLEWRSSRGLIPRFDETFLKDIWQSLPRVRSIIFGDVASAECMLDCELVSRSMTPGEESFAKLIDGYVQQVHPHYYRSAILETLYAYAQYCAVNKDADFGEYLNLGDVLEMAANLYVEKTDQHLEEFSRNLDVFIEQSPYVVQQFLAEALPKFLKSTAKPA